VKSDEGVLSLVEPTTERGKRVAALSQRLRVLHSELTTETLELRYEQLRDEVQRVVSALQPHERERFLQELMAEFPVWSAGGAPLPSAPSTSATMMMKIEPEVTDPKALMEKLVAACKGLPEHERAKIEAGLRAKGLVKQEAPVAAASEGGGTSGGAGMAQAEIAAIRKLLGLPPDAPVDEERVAAMGPIGADFVIKGVEGPACAFWSQLCSSVSFTTKFPMAQVLRKDFERFISGDAKMTREVVERDVFKLKALVAAILLAFQRASEQFARDHATKFAPAEIQKAVGQGGLFGNQDARCWQMYVEMMKNVDKASIERRVRELTVKEIEAWLEGIPQMRAGVMK